MTSAVLLCLFCFNENFPFAVALAVFSKVQYLHFETLLLHFGLNLQKLIVVFAIILKRHFVTLENLFCHFELYYTFVFIGFQVLYQRLSSIVLRVLSLPYRHRLVRRRRRTARDYRLRFRPFCNRKVQA